jgi:hypothetical protein
VGGEEPVDHAVRAVRTEIPEGTTAHTAHVSSLSQGLLAMTVTHPLQQSPLLFTSINCCLHGLLDLLTYEVKAY